MANNYSQATLTPDLPATLFDEEELTLLETACGLTFERYDENIYFFADQCFREEGDDEDGETVDCLALMQQKLRQLDPIAYPHIAIQGAATCSKMRPDEFGGFAYLITRTDVRSISTWEWLHQQTRRTDVLPVESA
jgi:hypothetical protein